MDFNSVQFYHQTCFSHLVHLSFRASRASLPKSAKMPAVKGDGMRGLAVFISDIRNCKLNKQFWKKWNATYSCKDLWFVLIEYSVGKYCSTTSMRLPAVLIKEKLINDKRYLSGKWIFTTQNLDRLPIESIFFALLKKLKAHGLIMSRVILICCCIVVHLHNTLRQRTDIGSVI